MPCLRLALPALALVAGLGLAACRGKQASQSGPGGGIKVVAEGPAQGFQVLSEDPATTGTRLRLRWSGDLPRPTDDPEPLGLCLPPGEQITAHWAAATLNGKPVPIQRSLIPTTGTQPGSTLPWVAGTVDSCGIMRHWPIYSFKPGREVFDLLQRAAAAGPPALELTLDLTWQKPFKSATPPAPANSTPTKGEESWRRVARGLVANPAALDRFQVPPAPQKDVAERITDPRRLAPGNRPWARIQITSEGLTRVNLDDLLKAGFPAAAIKAENVRIFSHGQPVPLLLAPGPDLPAGVKPGVYFHAQAGSGPYTAARAYWVTLGADLPAARLPQASDAASPQAARPLAAIQRTVTRNIDSSFQLRQDNLMAIDGMDWVEAGLEIAKPFEVTLDLPGYVPTGAQLEAELSFFITREDSLAPFKIETVSDREGVGMLTFFNVQDGKKKIKLPPHCVKNGRVTLTMRLLTDNPQPNSDGADSGFWFDRLTITYPSAPRPVSGRMTVTAGDAGTTQPLWAAQPDLDAPAAPPLVALALDSTGAAMRRLAPAADAAGHKGFRFSPAAGQRLEVTDARTAWEAPPADLVQFDNLAAEDQGADLLIIAHRDFMAQAAKLKAYHEAQGWTVRMAEIQSVYDTFSDGELSPLAIKNFLAWTLRHWKLGAPAQVLLVGDCTSDYLNTTRGEVRNWVPTYTYNRGGESWASDAWFTTVSGDDNLGDLMIGRISVANDRDAETVVKKTIAYDSASAPGPWRARLAFVSDDGEFPEFVDELRRNNTPEQYLAGKVFLNELPLEDNWYLPRNYVERKHMKVSRVATAKILETFRQGVSFLTYYGHGSPNIWTDERIWFGGDSPNSDNQHLKGSGTAAFVANMTCNSGAIDYPLAPWNICITEDMMRVEDGGAIACFVPSGPGVTTIHREMSKALGRALFDAGLRRFGEVAALAKARYALAGNPEDLIYMYHLLGDPVASLQLAARRAEFDPRPGAASPGGTLECPLTGVEPAAGQWTGELVGEDGGVLWSSPAAPYQDGRIAVKASVPENAKHGGAVLRVYAWDPASGQDLAAAGRLTIQRPALALDRIAITPPAGAELTISNPGRVEARGDIEFVRLDEKTSRSLARETVTLAGGEQKKITVAAPAPAAGEGAAVIEARLRLPDVPDDPGTPQLIRKRAVLGAPAGWTGWIKPLCTVEERAAEGAIVRVCAAVPKGSGAWNALLRIAANRTQTSQSLTADPDQQDALKGSNPAVDVISTAFMLDRNQLVQALKTGAISFKPAAGGREQCVLPLPQLAHKRAWLGFVPGSVHARPARPTEGDTVFIDLAVENRGDLDGAPASVDLLVKPPAQGGEPAFDFMQNGPRQIPVLAPGRRLPVTLRWDPSNNAGRQTVYPHLRLASGAGADCEQTTDVVVEVLTKASLSIGDVTVVATPRDLDLHRLTLKAQVKNSGQTDARNVMVSFYRSALLTPENRVGEPVDLKMVAGGGAALAQCVWTYDPEREGIDAAHLPKPKAQVWLKGSTQRISNVEEKGSFTGN